VRLRDNEERKKRHEWKDFQDEWKDFQDEWKDFQDKIAETRTLSTRHEFAYRLSRVRPVWLALTLVVVGTELSHLYVRVYTWLVNRMPWRMDD
jgi:hypothetical protein